MKRLVALFLLVGLVLFAGFTKSVSADVNDFVINDFTADYYLTRDDPQGSMRIVERIDLTYSDFNHGILRALPDSYKGQPLKTHINSVTSETDAPSQFTTYGESGNIVVKIGDPNQTVTGHQKYTIDYSVQNAITFYDDHDELYWNINGNQWGQQFTKVSANFHFPEELKPNDNKCFTGAYGNTQQACTTTEITDGYNFATSRKLQPYETLTSVISLPKNYFTRPTKADWWEDNYKKILALVSVPVLVVLPALRYWYRNGRDSKGRGVIVPQYDAPEGLRPAEAGTVADFRVDNRDISSTIIDLAIRKYIKIVEVKKDRLILKDTITYEFELIKTDANELKSYEKDILWGLFSAKSELNLSIGQKIQINELKNKFYKTIQEARESISLSLAQLGYFSGSPLRASGKLMIAVAAVFISLFVFGPMLGVWYVLGAGPSIVILIILAMLMPKRTEKGVAAKEYIEGLRLYLKVAEKDRIKMLQSPDSPYSQKTTEPKQTIELFEKLLPYAIVLEVEKEWANQFKDIYTTPPDWYGGNWTTFNTLVFASSLSSSLNTMGANFSPPQSSSGSGFSGGGGSGGGGGGGGW